MSDDTPTPTMTHRATCKDPGNTGVFVGKLGDRMLGCRSCKAFRVLRDDEAAPAPPEPVTGSRYRCPLHTDRAVRPDGRGCPDCAADRARRRERRR